MLIKLPSSIVSSQDLSELIEKLGSKELDSNICQVFFAANPRVSQESQSVAMMVEYLQKILYQSAEIEVTFAQDADDDIITELVEWVRLNIKENLLVNIKTDPLLTGGCVVRSAQRIYDFSWASILDGRREELSRLVDYAH